MAMLRSGGLVAAAAVAVLGLAACGPATAPSTPSAATSTTTSSTTAPEPSAAAAAAPLATDAHGYTITSITAPGSQPGKSVTIPQLSGGDPAVTARFNAAMQASRAGMPEQSADMSVDDGELPGGFGSGVTRIGSGVVAGRIVLLWYGRGAAHPNHSLGTVVIETHTATPVTVDDLYQDRAAALARLRTLLPQLDVSRRLDEQWMSGDDIAANWLPTPTGLEVYVPVAHVMGDYVAVPVPWDRIADLLRPGMLDVLRAD
ncbi:hypothetical protein [Mycolicibacterium lutetiense]